jgi:hypothetical protein
MSGLKVILTVDRKIATVSFGSTAPLTSPLYGTPLNFRSWPIIVNRAKV